MSIVLNLELNVPRLRPNAFPWGAAEVNLAAKIRVSSSNSLIRRVDLPSSVDLSTLLLLSSEEGCLSASDEEDNTQQPTRTRKSLDVEIIGCDHGITFSIGTVTLNIPDSLKPGPEQTSSNPEAFRLALMDGTAARVGMISGAFVARRQAVAPTPKPEAIRPTATSAIVDEASSESQKLVGHNHGGKCQEDDVDSKVAALLDLASSMLTNAKGLTSAAAPRRPRNHGLFDEKSGDAAGNEAPSTEAVSEGGHRITRDQVDALSWHGVVVDGVPSLGSLS